MYSGAKTREFTQQTPDKLQFLPFTRSFLTSKTNKNGNFKAIANRDDATKGE